jgi:hypothetical protein
MNAFRFTNGSRRSKWLLVTTLCVVAAGCNEPTTQDQASKPAATAVAAPAPAQAQEQVGDAFVLANNDGTIPNVQGLVATTAVRISLPRDQSTFPPGPDLGTVDTTPCLACHTPTDIAEFTAPPGPRFKLVNEQCRDCHSADYTSSQPIMTRASWQKVVTKMVDKFGAADINSVHQPLMLDYIVAVYGKP